MLKGRGDFHPTELDKHWGFIIACEGCGADVEIDDPDSVEPVLCRRCGAAQWEADHDER